MSKPIISGERDDFCSPLVVRGYPTGASDISYSFEKGNGDYFRCFWLQEVGF
jgi:hypothetical protein